MVYPVAIKRCSKIMYAFLHLVDKVSCIGQVRVRVTAAKVRQRNTIHGALTIHSQFIHQYRCHIRPHNYNTPVYHSVPVVSGLQQGTLLYDENMNLYIILVFADF